MFHTVTVFNTNGEIMKDKREKLYKNCKESSHMISNNIQGFLPEGLNVVLLRVLP